MSDEFAKGGLTDACGCARKDGDESVRVGLFDAGVGGLDLFEGHHEEWLEDTDECVRYLWVI